MSTFEEKDYREGFAGGCYRGDEPVCVAEPETFCNNGVFYSAHFLRGNSGHPLRYCAGELENVMIGRCGSGIDGTLGQCANMASRCPDPATFEPYDPTCSIVHDVKQGIHTTYGRCGSRCAWSPQDCLAGESWVANDPTCTSEKVQIGSCFAGHAFCAVSNSACINPTKPYYNHQETRELFGVNCYLSLIPSTEPPQAPSPPVAPSPAAPSTPSAPTVPSPTAGLESEASSNDGSTLSGVALIGIAVGSSVLIGIIMGVIGFRLGRTSRRSKSTCHEKDSTLPKTLDVPASHHESGGFELEDMEDLSVN